jgi:hypothetical protein
MQATVVGDGFGGAQGDSFVTFGGSKAVVESWGIDRIVCRVPDDLSGTVPVTVTTAGGTSEAAHFSVTYPKWHLAEGSTAWGFDTTINILNPCDADLAARVTFARPDGTASSFVLGLAGGSQSRLNPRDLIGDCDFSTVVECVQGETIAVDRTMSWTGDGARSPEAHNSIGVTAPSSTWHLPEGSSAWGFETWTLVQNPNDMATGVLLTYMVEGEGARAFKKEVPARSRASFSMVSDIGARDSSIEVKSDLPVVVERSQYRNGRREGSCSIGATTAAQDYYFGEGTTAWGFTTYLLVQNPGRDSAEVAVTCMTPDGPVAQPAFTVPAGSRETVRVNDSLPATDFSASVHGSRPIVAERAVYWNSGADEACHDSIGLTGPRTTFWLPDGEASDGTETWTLVQNPNRTAVDVEISYLTPAGETNVIRKETIPAVSRRTFNLAEHSGLTGRAGIMVTSKTSGAGIIVERSMYFNDRLSGTNTTGCHPD